MGKAKRGKKKPKVSNPIAVPDVVNQHGEAGGSGDHAIVCEKETEIQTIIEQLQSASVEDKIFGLHSLATVFPDAGSVADVMRHKVVRLAAPLLVERSSFLRNAAAGALRNLSACGSEEVCALLVEQDVMTPLQALIGKYAAEWAPSPRKGQKEDVVDEQVDTFVQCVHLLWNLCENNERALKYFNDGNLLPVLVKCLDHGTYGVETAVAVAHCLNTVTEDNLAASQKLKEVEADIIKLITLEGAEPPRLLLRVLACGLLLNIHAGRASSVPAERGALMVRAVSDVLAVDARARLNALSSDLAAMDEQAAARAVDLEETMLLAQQTALETLANLCNDDSDECDENAMEQDLSDGSDEPPYDVCGDQGAQFAPTLPVGVHEAVVSCGLLVAVRDKTAPPPENVTAILRDHTQAAKLVDRTVSLRCRAFLCLNNLLSALDSTECGGATLLYPLWLEVGRAVFAAQHADARLVEAATAAMRAALQRLAGQEDAGALFAQLADTDVQMMVTGAQKSDDANVRANLIRCLGTLGMIVAHCSEANRDALLKVIGRSLVEAAAREAELWVSAEALDAIMDVFGEDATDVAAADISLVDKLRSILPTFKQKVRSQRKALGDHEHVVATVNANLRRFIDYKADATRAT